MQHLSHFAHILFGFSLCQACRLNSCKECIAPYSRRTLNRHPTNTAHSTDSVSLWRRERPAMTAATTLNFGQAARVLQARVAGLRAW
eukprot:6188846-Pleurochrysis_carterae.AAC.1